MYSLLVLSAILFVAVPITSAYTPNMVTPTGYSRLRQSGSSSLYTVNLPSSASYKNAPLLLDLRGSHHQIGYDYAALLQNETRQVFSSFVSTILSSTADQILLELFLDYCWDSFLAQNTPQEYLDELQGMQDYHKQSGDQGLSIDFIAHRYYALANMPADPDNIISMLEEELEGNWPEWLKVTVNDIIKILEKIISGCDAFGVWGSRTEGGLLYSSRNLDWNRNTGIDQFKLITFYHITDSKYQKVGDAPIFYGTLGFASGLGALAGMNNVGISVSEMNLDNSVVTFNGLAFPLRLRYILEQATNLQSALSRWTATNNTNSFNFLIGSASDVPSGKGANALETIMGYTSVYGPNSDIEKSASFYCAPGQCSWTNETGKVMIGKPMTEAVWRTNHAFDPLIMQTQEPLFNDTVFRYNLLHDMFEGYEKNQQKISDKEAVTVTGVLGTKGVNFFSCDLDNFRKGENIMSITYAPGVRPNSKNGYLYVAWEQGGNPWIPAACNPYVLINFDDWV